MDNQIKMQIEVGAKAFSGIKKERQPLLITLLDKLFDWVCK